jgi:hypothetical protein
MVMMAHGNGSGPDYVERSAAEVEAAGDREGLRWLARRMRDIRISILRLIVHGNQLSLELECELKNLEDEFRRQVEGDDDE